MKDTMQPQDPCATVESHNIKSKVIIFSLDTWSTSYKQVSTMLTMIL